MGSRASGLCHLRFQQCGPGLHLPRLPYGSATSLGAHCGGVLQASAGDGASFLGRAILPASLGSGFQRGFGHHRAVFCLCCFVYVCLVYVFFVISLSKLFSLFFVFSECTVCCFCKFSVFLNFLDSLFLYVCNFWNLLLIVICIFLLVFCICLNFGLFLFLF